MALSNIRREPRREITEQAIGVFYVLVCGPLSYYFARSIYAPQSFWDDPDDLGLMILFLAFPFWVYLFLLATHEVGEVICGWMTALGLDPRPKNRYR